MSCESNEVRFTDLSRGFGELRQQDSPDCDQDTVLADFLNLLSEIVDSDGVIDDPMS